VVTTSLQDRQILDKLANSTLEVVACNKIHRSATSGTWRVFSTLLVLLFLLLLLLPLLISVMVQFTLWIDRKPSSRKSTSSFLNCVCKSQRHRRCERRKKSWYRISKRKLLPDTTNKKKPCVCVRVCVRICLCVQVRVRCFLKACFLMVVNNNKIQG